MNPDNLPFDSVHLLPEDWDEVEHGEIEIPGVRRDAIGEETA